MTKASLLHYTLRNNPNKDPLQPPPEVIGGLIDIVPNNNIFEFDDSYYLQVQGIAMGTKMAPAYANIVVGEIEDKIPKDLPGLLIWKRYIDNIFVVANCSKEQFKS